MDDAKATRAEDSKSQSDKEGALAETTGQLVTDEGGLKNKKIDLMDTEKVLGGLHVDCDWLLKCADARAEAELARLKPSARPRMSSEHLAVDQMQVLICLSLQKN